MRALRITLLFLLVPLLTWGYDYHVLAEHIHVVEVNPNEHEIRPVRAEGDREKVSSLARQYGAVVAINGGFFRPSGEPAGVLVIDKQQLGAPAKPRGAIGWANGGTEVLIDRLLSEKGVLVPQTSHSLAAQWEEMDHVVGGAPVLVQDGVIVSDFAAEQTTAEFIERPHTRTAVGVREDGTWVFVVYNWTKGVSIPKLAELMVKLGCERAVNLDGGSSSTLFVDGEVVNRFWGERTVSDAILVLP